MLEKIVALIRGVGKLSEINPEEDYYDAGLSSINALELLMELESTFEISIPDDRFIKARTPKALNDLISDLKQEHQLP
jgi:acyl carrier protein